MNNNDVILSIYVATYNHEKYIVRALDSILMQKTKYKFEVLVGEDCSTDSTRAVLKEYEKQHPGKFQIFYREKNMYHEKCNNVQDLKLRCKGKYKIALEGDDYWIDENKIEKQLDFLESHPEYIAVAHNCIVVDENSEPNGEVYPQCTDEEYTTMHFFCDILPGQLTTLMYRDYMKDDKFDYSILEKGLSPDDRLLYFALLCHGKIFCMQETMSAYRHITTHGSSFSANYKFDFFYQKKWQQEFIDYVKKHSGKKELKIAEYQLFYFICKGLLSKQLSLGQAIKEYSAINHKIAVILIAFKRFINKKIFHKKIYT